MTDASAQSTPPPHSVLLDPRDLFRLAEPRVADISEHDVGEHRFSDVPHV